MNRGNRVAVSLTLLSWAFDRSGLTEEESRRVAAYCEWVFSSAIDGLRWPETVCTHLIAALEGADVAWMTPRDCRKAVATVLGVEDAHEQLGHSPDSNVTLWHYVEKPLERPEQAVRLEVFASENSE